MFLHLRALSFLVCAGLAAASLCACQPRATTMASAPQMQSASLSVRNVSGVLPGPDTPDTVYRANLCPTIMSLGEDVADAAREHIGVRYRSGGASPKSGFDCSGFVYWVFSKQGVTVPRDSVRQSRAGQEVAKADLIPGDILIFRIANTPQRPPLRHLSRGRTVHPQPVGRFPRAYRTTQRRLLASALHDGPPRSGRAAL